MSAETPDRRSLDHKITHWGNLLNWTTVWVYLAEGKPLKFGLLVTAARFALTDPKINTALSLSLSMSSLRPASSGYSYLLLLHSTDFDEATPLGIIGHKPRAHRLLFSATTCAQSLQFVPSGPLSTPHPVCCPERWSELITSKDCYVLCLPVGFGQWEALAGDNKKGGKWVGDIYLSGSFLWDFFRLVSVNTSSLLLSRSSFFVTFIFQVLVTFPFTHTFEFRHRDQLYFLLLVAPESWILPCNFLIPCPYSL